MRKGMYQKGVRDEKLLRGIYGVAVEWLNPGAGVFFMIGLISMSVFVTTNLNYEHSNNSGSFTATNTPAAAATSAPATTATATPTTTATATKVSTVQRPKTQ